MFLTVRTRKTQASWYEYSRRPPQGLVTCGVSAEVKLKAPFWASSQGLLTSGPFLAAGARAERYITPLRYTLCARGLFPFGQRGELLALGNLDISGAAALALRAAVRCKRPPSCRLFPTNSASVRRNPTCTGTILRSFAHMQLHYLSSVPLKLCRGAR